MLESFAGYRLLRKVRYLPDEVPTHHHNAVHTILLNELEGS